MATSHKKSSANPLAKKAPAAKTKVKSSATFVAAPSIPDEQRRHYIAVAAFYIAQRRGFTFGDPVTDWLAAEAEIDNLIASGHFAT